RRPVHGGEPGPDRGRHRGPDDPAPYGAGDPAAGAGRGGVLGGRRRPRAAAAVPRPGGRRHRRTPVTAPPAAPGTADLDRLPAALLAARYDVDSVQALLGPVAHPALARGERVPALRASADGTPLATLVRLFLIGVPCPEAAVRAAFAPLGLAAALSAGLVEPA